MKKIAVLITIIIFVLTITSPPPATVKEAEIGLSRIWGFFLSVLSAYFLGKIIQKFTKVKLYLGYSLFMLSPWRNYIFIFHLPEALSLCLFIISFWFLINKNKIGVVLAVLFAGAMFWTFNMNSNASFAKGLRLAKLGAEINETQKINFLATEKKFILPSLVRKLTYNKPKLLVDKIIRQGVSFFDFEQLMYPLDSYEIIRLSGLAPRGNVPLILLWEMPLIIYGLVILKKDRKYFGSFLILFMLAFLPYLYYEKKFLAVSGFFIIPLVVFVEILAIKKILKKRILSMVLLIIFVIPSYINFYKFFYYESEKYINATDLYFRKISEKVENYLDKYDQIVVTDRFGDTEMMTRYYLKNNLENVKFGAFQLTDEAPIKNTLYMGMIGEFVGKGSKLDARPIPTNFSLLETVNYGEVVFDHGDKLWIGHFDI